jgi:membrane protease YdiL (CAAX protease family)
VILVLMAAGALAILAGWVVVGSGRASVWVVMGAVLGTLGVASLATGRIVASGRLGVWAAVAAGVGAGVVLYGATAAFVAVVRRWPVFDRHVAEIYDQRRGLSLSVALFLAAGVVAPGEELFWRGLFQGRAVDAVGSAGGAVLTWVAYVAANGGSGSLPILAAAVVSGGVWGGLALWTRGVVASLCCHAGWTALMLALPPGGRGRT